MFIRIAILVLKTRPLTRMVWPIIENAPSLCDEVALNAKSVRGEKAIKIAPYLDWNGVEWGGAGWNGFGAHNSGTTSEAFRICPFVEYLFRDS